MATYAAVFRAVNVAGHQLVGMAALRGLASSLGFGAPRTLLQSGNLLFESRARPAANLEALIEREAAGRLGLQTDVMVRSAADLKAVVSGNPFPSVAKEDPGHLVVVFLKQVPAVAGVQLLQGAIRGREVVQVAGRHAYITYPDGIGRSRLTMPVIERALATRGTGRNWNTVGKLAALALGAGDGDDT
jgi:uncharacterized protein (DUF1697 family)